MYRYIGGGSYLIGVPARDLSDAEYATHREIIEANAKATGRALYVEDKPPAKTSAKKQADTQAEKEEE